MEKDERATTKTKTKEGKIPTVSRVCTDGTLIELVYDHNDERTRFAVSKDGAWRFADRYIDTGRELVPYSATNNLVKHGVILFPSEPIEYGSHEELVNDIQSFMHRYVTVTPRFERIASYYVLLSWLYDSFNELPYLRVRGDYGSGKTRFLLIAGSLCYKPVFASGTATVSPIFHILDTFGGTLIVDEADFRLSDEKADMVKILNNGNMQGFPVLRTEVSRTGEFNPRAFQVFGPKLVATRGRYNDRALESRFITEDMDDAPALPDDMPRNLLSTYKDDALRLRNKLLLFRFRNFGKKAISKGVIDRTIEPRLNQIFSPLLSVIEDEHTQEELSRIARQYNADMMAERGMDTEAHVLSVIRDLLTRLNTVSIKDITNEFNRQYAKEYHGTVSSKWMGTFIRTKLNLKPRKMQGVYVIPPTERLKLTRLYERYGLTADESLTAEELNEKEKKPDRQG